MSSPQIPSSPLFFPSSVPPSEDTASSFNDGARTPMGNGNGNGNNNPASSDINFGDYDQSVTTTPTQNSRRVGFGEVSSPLRFSSSPTRTPRPSSGQQYQREQQRHLQRQQQRQMPASSQASSSLGLGLNGQPSSNIYSDIEGSSSGGGRSDLLAGHASRSRRGDVSSDIFSTPNRRRYVNMGNGNNTANNLTSDGSIMSMGLSSDIGGIPSLSARGDTSELNNDEPVRVIWGTNVSIQEASNAFRGFLEGFKSKYRIIHDGMLVNRGEGEELVYITMLNQMRLLGLSNLNLDIRNLKAYPPTVKLYYQLINYPQEIIPIMDQTVKDCMVSLVINQNLNNEAENIETKVYKVRPYNIDNQKGMRELNPGDIDKLVSVKGLVLRSTPIIPDMKETFFKCNICGHTLTVEIDRGTILEPTECPRPMCKSKNSMQVVHNRSIFADKQVIKLQETPDNVPDGQTPHSISLCVYDELVDICKAGDRVEVTGIFRSVPVKINPRQRSLKSLFKTYIDIVHIQKVDKKRMGIDVSTVGLEDEIAQNQPSEVEELRKITADDISLIKEVAERRDVYELLARSLAPSIYEMDDVKKGVLLQLFGGANKTFNKGGSPRYRGDINVLLIGDPSTSKSQMLQYVHKIAPRGVFTSGKGSSAVGLTAYITRDQDTKQLVLESGALVLSDGGVCCIDEFDKMSDSTRSVLHEVMEQQTISIAKAGIITTLNARTSIIASANPVGSKYDPNLTVTQNIDLPPTLISRFDLVYLMLDKVDEQLDRKLARHITSMYLEDVAENAAEKEILPVEFLTMYISYAKQHIKPQITLEAKDELVKAYVDMRKLGDDSRSSEKRITATTRQLESMIRLSEAHAKMRLSSSVTVEDVHEAVRLIKSALKDYAVDPRTGKIDMDLISSGTTASQRRMRLDLKKEVLSQVNQLTSNGGDISFNQLRDKLNEIGTETVVNNELGDVLRELSLEGQLVIFGEGHTRRIRRTVSAA